MSNASKIEKPEDKAGFNKKNAESNTAGMRKPGKIYFLFSANSELTILFPKRNLLSGNEMNNTNI